MSGVAYVFLNRNGAKGYGHVGGAFQLANGNFRCFSSENQTGSEWISANFKGGWAEDCHNSLEAVIRVFQRPRLLVIPPGIRDNFGKPVKPGSYPNERYTEWKRFDVDAAYPDIANAMLAKRQGEDYNVVSRNCENDVYDVLHDTEGFARSGYGISANKDAPVYIGWVQTSLGPKTWFDEHIRASASACL